MNTLCIDRIYDKYPEKILAALDDRTATIYREIPAKNIPFASSDSHHIRVRKPRSEESLKIRAFDEELELFVQVEDDTVYYMPGNRACYETYTTAVPTTSAIYETTEAIAHAALCQSIAAQGQMNHREVRIFWVTNLGEPSLFHCIHLTVLKQRREYRIVAELGFEGGERYTKLLSLRLAINA